VARNGLANLCLEDEFPIRSALFAELQFHLVGEADKLPARVDLVDLKTTVLLAASLLFERIAGAQCE